MNDLKKLNQWVVWKRDPERGKIPKNAKTGGNAQSNNPQTWSSYELCEKVASKYDGVGFMFANGICGIDIDKAIGNAEREVQANDIIQLMNTYTEYSPSGTGYHIIFKCDISKLPMDYKERFYQKPTQTGIECYISGMTNRYFTYTGEAINDNDIEERTEQLLTFLDKYMKKKNPLQHASAVEENTLNKSSFDIISIALQAKNRKTFRSLFYLGDISKYNNDDSAADIALCNMIAFYAGNNPALIDEVFRLSKLYRDKWEREDYRTATIRKAIDICNGEFYKHKNKPSNPKKELAHKEEPQKTTSPIQVKQYAGAIYINPFETPTARQRYRWNDIGVGNLFADTYKNISRYVPEAKSWYVYDGRVWRQDLGGVIVAQQAKDLTDYMLDCRKFLDDYKEAGEWVKFVSGRMTRKALDNMIALAITVYPVSILEFDKNPYIFNCQNCTLDLKNFTMHKHRADDFLSKISNVTFDKTAKCDRWESFISEIMNDDTDKAKFLQKALGYTLTGDTSEECFFILYGSTTRNGKGTCMETTLHILGDYGRTAQPDSIAQKQNPNGSNANEDIARLKGARFVNMSEPDKGLRLNSALVKQITGGDTVTARFLHQNSFEYRPEYKLFINTNHLPKVSDDSIFSSDRVKLIPFERHFEGFEQDKGLKNLFKQPENMSGIFNWFIEGLKLMRTDGLEQPQAVRDATAQYRYDSDTIGQFICDCLVIKPTSKILTKDVHAEYENWCADYGYSPLNNRNLVTELKRKGLIIGRGTGNKVYLFDYAIVYNGELPKEMEQLSV